ncbi:TPA: Arc family DNA-binding protein [Citrobacter youngae]|nr:Arc family DNA-binding protein [Citrobacter youngae]
MKGASLIAPFGLRMPEELKEKVAERAKNNGRSMNAEIVQILQDAMNGNTISMDDEFIRVFNEVTHSQHETVEEFDAMNEKVDWLIDKLMEKIDRESANVRVLLQAKKNLTSKKPT